MPRHLRAVAGRQPGDSRRRRLWWWGLTGFMIPLLIIAALLIGRLMPDQSLHVEHVHALAVAARSRLLYAGAHEGLFAGAAFGRRWQQVGGLVQHVPAGADIDAMQVVIDPHEDQRLWVAGHFLGVVRSRDGGSTWEDAFAGLPAASGRHPDVHALAYGATAPERLYAWVEGHGLFTSTDGADHWVPLSRSAANVEVLALAVDPRQPQTLYAGGAGGIAISGDGGRTWDLINSPANVATFKALWADPNRAGRVLAASDLGLWLSTDSGASWQRLVGGQVPQDLAALAGNPDRPGELYLSSVQGQIYTSQDAGRNWSKR